MVPVTLYAESVPRTFGPLDRAAFVAALEEQDRYTVQAPLDLVEQVLLTPDGKTQRGGFRYSPTAFRQLCRTACPGLSNVVTDVAGMRRVKSEADRNRFSPGDAIAVLNTILRRRFRSDLEGLQAVRDTRTGVIEGVVGRLYRRLPNSELFARSTDVLKAYRLPVEFFQADLVGRSMILCYRGAAPLFSVAGPRGLADDFFGGFYYSNSEVGDGSVRATTVLVRGLDGTRSLGFFGRAGRLIHAGKDFNRRFERLLDAVVDRQPDAAALRDGVEKMAARRVGFTGDPEADERRFHDLGTALQARQITKSLAKRILRGLVLRSSYDKSEVADARYVRKSDWASRTAFDLYTAMGRASRTLPVGLREHVEQMAHSLLLGRLNLRDEKGTT